MLELKLQTNDLKIFNFMSKFLYVQDIHIATLCAIGVDEANKITKRLVKEGYLIHNKILSDRAPYISLATKAYKLLELKPKTYVALNTLAHDTLLVSLYLYLATTDSTIVTDLELKREKSFNSTLNKYKLPDLLINDTRAIELELSQKSHARLVEIVAGYVINNDISQVEYYVKTKALAHKIWQLTQDNPKFKFYLINLDINEQIISIEPIDMELQNTSSFMAKDTQKSFGGYVFK